jgi:hypothetical protein
MKKLESTWGALIEQENILLHFAAKWDKVKTDKLQINFLRKSLW